VDRKMILEAEMREENGKKEGAACHPGLRRIRPPHGNLAPKIDPMACRVYFDSESFPTLFEEANQMLPRHRRTVKGHSDVLSLATLVRTWMTIQLCLDF
jgi:hypothetical protein